MRAARLLPIDACLMNVFSIFLREASPLTSFVQLRGGGNRDTEDLMKYPSAAEKA